MEDIPKQTGSAARRFWPALAAALMLLGLALRVVKAWTGQFSPNADYGVVALMAKHMSEGRDFPAFFYGQPYMGSLEPAVSAVLCRILGPSGFAVCLGTALVGALLLPLVYVCARDAGSRRAGVMALLYSLVGSDTLFHYSVAVRGGYMAMMVCGVLTLWLAARIATREACRRPASTWAYAAMGLAAGMGWWSTQLVVPFLAATAVTLCVALRGRVFRRGVFAAAAGFLLGSLPWWLWNLTHDWATLDFASSLGKVAPGEGLRSFAGQFLVITELNPLSRWWNPIRLLALLALLGGFIAITARDRRREAAAPRFYFRLAVPLVWLFMALVYVTSHYARYHTSRYLLPLVPALAVAIGVGCDRLQQQTAFPVGWLLLALLIPRHLYEVHGMRHDLKHDRPRWQAASQVADELQRLGSPVAYGGYDYYWMNFASGERLCVADMGAERYAPYAARAELTLSPVVLDDYRRFRAFLDHTGATSRRASPAGIALHYDLTPPPEGWRYLNAGEIVAAVDEQGAPCLPALADAVMDTDWTVPSGDPAAVTVTFARPVRLCGLRLLSGSDRYPRLVEVEGGAADQSAWRTVLPETRATGYFWSGPYLQLEGLQFQQEFRFRAPAEGVERIRLTLQCDAGFRVSEVLFLEEGPPPAAGLPSPEACLAAVQQAGVRRLYAPRWLSEQIAARAGDARETPLPMSLTRTVQDLPATESACPQPLDFAAAAALIVDARDAPRTRAVLQGSGIPWTERPLDRLVLLVVPQRNAGDPFRGLPVMYWTEAGGFAVGPGKVGKREAQILFEEAVARHAAGNAQAALALLHAALERYPCHQPARRALSAALEAAGRGEEAARQAALLREQTVPAVAAPIRFGKGIEFIGLTPSRRRAAPGESLEVVYYWKCPPGVRVADVVAFVHWERGHDRFHDDHALLEEVSRGDLDYQPFPEIFTETRAVTVPEGMPAGEYRLVTGLYNRMDGRRLRPRTSLSRRRRAVACPLVFEVVARPEA